MESILKYFYRNFNDRIGQYICTGYTCPYCDKMKRNEFNSSSSIEDNKKYLNWLERYESLYLNPPKEIPEGYGYP